MAKPRRIQGMFRRLYYSILHCQPSKPRPGRGNAPSVDWILAHRQFHLRDQLRQHIQPRGYKGDALMTSLYRLYVDIVDDCTLELRNKVEYFFNQAHWRIAHILDPTDLNPARYAILSVIPHLLVLAFNRWVERGLPRGAPAAITDPQELEARPRVLEEMPAWCQDVPPLAKTLSIPDEDGQFLLDVK